MLEKDLMRRERWVDWRREPTGKVLRRIIGDER